MLRFRTKVTTSPTALRRRSSASSHTAASSGPLAPSSVTISSTPTCWLSSTPASTSPTGPPALGVEPLLGPADVIGVDGEARGEDLARRLGGQPQPVEFRPGPLRIHVVR